MIDSFSDSYVQAQGKFLAAARDAQARLHHYGCEDVKGIEGEPLACDVAVLGAENAKRAAIIIAGTHGIEGFAGSAVLHYWLVSHRKGAGLEDLKLVLVHAINPWGFSHRTRTTEHNVDLNRNFILDNIGYERPNPAYDELARFLYIDAFDAARTLEAYRGYRAYLDRKGWHLENEMFEGQSHRSDGLCYAGKEPSWSNVTFRRILNEHLAQAERIGFLDWHTGVGSFGEVVYLIFDPAASPEYAAAAGWWGRIPSDKSAYNAGATPRFRGLLCQSIRQERPDAKIAGAVVEFGTGDDYAIFRADRLDRWLRHEGRGDPDRERFRDDYKNALCPRDLSWRRLVLREGPAIMDRLIEGVRAWRD